MRHGLTPEKVAEEIELNKQEIIELYKLKIAEAIELPAPLRAGDEIVVVLPRQIDNIIQSLIKCTACGSHLNSLAKEHARLRAKNKVFTLELLISEFIILKDAIYEVLQTKAPISFHASNLIWQYIITSIKVAVTEFERNRAADMEEMNSRITLQDEVNADITQQMLKSKESEQLFKALVEGMDQYAVFTTDPKGFVLTWNHGAERIEGYSSEEIIGKHFSILYPEDAAVLDEPMHHLHTALIEGNFRGEGLRKRKNGDLFLADVYLRPVFSGNKHIGFAKVVADLTERNTLIQAASITETENSQLKLEKLLREQFVNTLSHDLRGPLTVARASAELAKRDLTDTHNTLKFIDRTILNIDRTTKMITDMLNFKKIQAGGGYDLKLREWDMRRLVKYACEDFRLQGFSIETSFIGEDFSGVWDGEAIRRVVENLLSNAIKYGDEDYPVSVEVKTTDNLVSVRVHNMGNTINPADIQNLFSVFNRSESVKSKEGWGIGLSLVKGITEAHGGTVSVESYPEEGTTFRIDLPRLPQNGS